MFTIFELLQDGFVGGFHVYAIDLIPGCHDVIHGHLLQVENIDQHTAVPTGNH